MIIVFRSQTEDSPLCGSQPSRFRVLQDLSYLLLQGRRGGSAFSGSHRLEALSPSRKRVSVRRLAWRATSLHVEILTVGGVHFCTGVRMTCNTLTCSCSSRRFSCVIQELSPVSMLHMVLDGDSISRRRQRSPSGHGRSWASPHVLGNLRGSMALHITAQTRWSQSSFLM